MLLAYLYKQLFTFSAHMQHKKCAQLHYNAESRFLKTDTFAKFSIFSRYQHKKAYYPILKLYIILCKIASVELKNRQFVYNRSSSNVQIAILSELGGLINGENRYNDYKA